MKDKNKPLVSIVTTSYNHGRFIEDTILSVKNQDYPNIEHIIVDGGSVDNTLEILKKYEGTYNMRWISEPDEGQSDAANKGFRMAKGEIIGWLDSDDVYFTQDVISYVVEQFMKNPDVDVIYGDNILINKDNVILRVEHTIPWFSYKRLLRRCFLSQPAVLFKKKIVKNYQLDVELDLPMDYDFWLRLSKDGVVFKHVNKIIAAERRHSAQKTARKEEMQEEEKKIKEKYGQHFGFNFKLHLYLDKILLAYLRVKGLTKLLSLYLKKDNTLAFRAKYDSTVKAIQRQLYIKSIED